MLRPASWTKPAGASPARVIAGEPGSRPRSPVERPRAERGVKTLFGGSKRAGRSAIGCESCSLVKSTGNAATKSVTLDRYGWWRLFRLLVKKRGRNLRAGQADRWTSDWFHDQGLHQLMGTIRYPKAA